MTKDVDPIKVRQARQGKPVLFILAISMALAFVAAWVLWGAVADETATAFLKTGIIASPEPVLATPESTVQTN